MKIRQTARHVAARRSLELPVVGDVIHDRLVDMHVGIFLDRAPEDRQDERRDHLEAFFDGTMAAYLAALQDGFTEAEARELTHVQANLEFYRLGWTEMMEIPPEELPLHVERYHTFFEDHAITPADPLGDFEPDGGLPGAPATPERREEGPTPFAEAGFADDVYVDDGEAVSRGPSDGPAG